MLVLLVLLVLLLHPADLLALAAAALDPPSDSDRVRRNSEPMNQAPGASEPDPLAGASLPVGPSTENAAPLARQNSRNRHESVWQDQSAAAAGLGVGDAGKGPVSRIAMADFSSTDDDSDDEADEMPAAPVAVSDGLANATFPRAHVTPRARRISATLNVVDTDFQMRSTDEVAAVLGELSDSASAPSAAPTQQPSLQSGGGSAGTSWLDEDPDHAFSPRPEPVAPAARGAEADLGAMRTASEVQDSVEQARKRLPSDKWSPEAQRTTREEIVSFGPMSAPAPAPAAKHAVPTGPPSAGAKMCLDMIAGLGGAKASGGAAAGQVLETSDSYARIDLGGMDEMDGGGTGPERMLETAESYARIGMDEVKPLALSGGPSRMLEATDSYARIRGYTQMDPQETARLELDCSSSDEEELDHHMIEPNLIDSASDCDLRSPRAMPGSIGMEGMLAPASLPPAPPPPAPPPAPPPQAPVAAMGGGISPDMMQMMQMKAQQLSVAIVERDKLADKLKSAHSKIQELEAAAPARRQSTAEEVEPDLTEQGLSLTEGLTSMSVCQPVEVAAALEAMGLMEIADLGILNDSERQVSAALRHVSTDTYTHQPAICITTC